MYSRPCFLIFHMFQSSLYCKTRLALDRFHDSSIPPRKCAKSSESVPKPEKAWIIAIFTVQMLFLKYKCYFFWCAEQKKFESAVQTFAALWHKFCRFLAWVLPPYDTSFAALCREFCHLMDQYKKTECSTKVCCIF